MQPQIENPHGPRAFHVMAKPAGPSCNLHCAYCFYLDKQRLFAGGGTSRMSDEVLEQYVRQYIQQQDVDVINFAWQGGEPTLLGVEFFQKAVELQKRYAEGKQITNALQTNGTLLTDEWCEFLSRENFLVGLSIDGAAAVNDKYRTDRNGKGSSADAMRGLDLLKKHRVEFNTLTVVNDVNARRPMEVYDFLKASGSTFWQFIPIVERLENDDARVVIAPPPEETGHAQPYPVASWCVPPRMYGEFLCAIFDRWHREDIGRIFVQQFEHALAPIMGQPPGVCVYAPTCGAALVIEHNGDVYSCDHFVFEKYRLGNILEAPLEEMVYSAKQREFGQAKRELLPPVCLQCRWREQCNGGCPKDRFASDGSGTHRLNYLCPGFKTFYNHADARLRRIAEVIRGRAAGTASARS